MKDTKHQIDIIAELISDTPITNRNISKLTGISCKRIVVITRKMEDDGIILRTGKNPIQYVKHDGSKVEQKPDLISMCLRKPMLEWGKCVNQVAEA